MPTETRTGTGDFDFVFNTTTLNAATPVSGDATHFLTRAYAATPNQVDIAFTGTNFSQFSQGAGLISGMVITTSTGVLTITGMSMLTATFAVLGQAGGNTLISTILIGADTLTGGTGVDHPRGFAGDDTIDGGSNVDTAVFSGNLSAYTITHTGGTATVSGTDGSDTLTNVEYFQFADQTVHFSPGAGATINFSAAPSTFMSSIRDFDGNDLGSASSWVRLGQVDIQGDGDQEQLFVNSAIGRWATVGPASDGLVYFDDHGWAGDTRVVGIYIDPLVTSGAVVAGSAEDSERRFQHDLQISNINSILGAGDYDHDGLQEVYFSLTDGTAYLHAYMHADGNIQYANYQSEQQVIDYLTDNGFSSSTYAGWFTHAGAGLDGGDHLVSF